LFDLAEKALKLSALLGVFGYMSLRAHLNYIGISSTSSLGLERYLMETYSLTATTFVNVVIMVTIMVIVLLPLYLIGQRILKYQRIGRPARRVWSRFRKLCANSFLPGVLILFIVLYYFWLLAMLTRYAAHVDVAVGELKADQLGDVTGLDWIYYRTFLVCLVGFLAYSYFAPSAQQSPPLSTASSPLDEPPAVVTRRNLKSYVWIGFLLATVLLALQLPLLYGRFVRSPIYPLVQVTASDRDAPVCGLLVLETESSLSLWRAENGIGQVIVLPRSSLRSVTTGQMLNLLTLARDSAANHSNVRPDCSDARKPD
jgi:hypothetical protein